MIQRKQRLVREFVDNGRRKKNKLPFDMFVGWRNFDDDRVSTLSNVKDIVRSDAYVLFYRHRHLAVNFSEQEQLERILTDTNQ